MVPQPVISTVHYTRAGIMIRFAEVIERTEAEEDLPNPWSGLATWYGQLLTSEGWSAISDDTFRKFTAERN